MAVVAEETLDFSHPDIAMGLAGLMFAPAAYAWQRVEIRNDAS